VDGKIGISISGMRLCFQLHFFCDFDLVLFRMKAIQLAQAGAIVNNLAAGSNTALVSQR
jgi:hypothetical protein